MNHQNYVRSNLDIIFSTDVSVAVRTPEAFVQPAFKAVFMEGMSTSWDHFDFLVLSEIAQADRTAFVFE